MTPIVRVLAHTTFLGVPADLLPVEKALKQQRERYDEALRDDAVDPNRSGNPTIDQYLSDRVVLAEAKRMVNAAGQDQGTDAERLVECAGRACYDSYGAGRPSGEYHRHIMDVNHGSVMEHASLTFFLGNISRGCTHELVRHRVGVAISQRSTRYVDENESPWAWHPLIDAFRSEWCDKKLPPGLDSEEPKELLGNIVNGVQLEAQHAYRTVVEKLQAWLIAKGADKFTARKQARGAARGLLGNALCTEMVWTVNLRALRGIIDQRVKAAADAEIRILFGRIYEEALPYWPTYLGVYRKRECPDGLGFELYDPNAAAEKLKLAEVELANLRAMVPAPMTDAPQG